MEDQSIIGTEFVSDLNQKTSFDPDESIFRGIWKEYERVVLHSIVTTFGLDGFIRDVKGGDVDTVKAVQESAQFKNARWKEKYEQRGAYDTKAYHSDPAYRDITAKARKEFNENGTTVPDTYIPGNNLIFNSAKGVGPWRRASLDHVIAAHEIHEDPVRILADIDPVSLANDPENLRFTCMSLNSKMGDMSIEEFLDWCDKNPDKVNWGGVSRAPIPDDVKTRLIEEDKRARDHYYNTISKNYYTSPAFYQDLLTSAATRGAQMGARQAAGFLFIELWMACKEELSSIEAGTGVKECAKAIVRGIKKGVEVAIAKHKELFRKFGEGFMSGMLSSFTTTLCNCFSVTSKDSVRYIRLGFVPIIQAGSILLINPNDLFLGDQLKNATVLLGTGASVIAGSIVGDKIAKTPIAQIPHVGKLIVRFTSVLISGLLSCTMLLILDRSKTINQLIDRMNQYASEEYRTKYLLSQFEAIAAELGEIDFESLQKECNQWNELAILVNHTSTEEELNHVLIEGSNQGLYKIPWTGDFRTFMRNRNNKLIFS